MGRASSLLGLALSLLAIYLTFAQAASRDCTARGGVLVLTASPGWACVAALPPRGG